MYESLHNHTVASDGVLSAIDLLKAAENNGFRTMALTDHDAVPSSSDLKILRSYDGPVKWLVGVELSSWVPKKVGDSDKGAVHILGLFVDPTNKPLIEFCRGAEASRMKRMRIYVKHLNSIGLDVTESDVQQAATSKNIGKPHMVKAVMAKPGNLLEINKMREQMRLDAEHNPTVMATYTSMMAEDPKQYPYYLFMGSEAYYSAPKTDFGGLLDFESTVKLIRGAGGIAVLAHWYLDKAKIPPAALEAILDASGVDGLETEIMNTISDHSGYTKDVRYLRELVKRYHLIEEVSADGHSAKDLAAFAQDSIAQYSVGQTARMIEHVQPNLRWSNL